MGGGASRAGKLDAGTGTGLRQVVRKYWLRTPLLRTWAQRVGDVWTQPSARK